VSGSLTAEQLARAETLGRWESRRPLNDVEAAELAHLRDLARAITGPAEVADNPATPFTDEARRPLITGEDNPATPEDESDYLGALKAEERQKFEAWLSKAWATLWRVLAPLVLQFGQAAIGAALAKVPHEVLIPGLVTLDLQPVLRAVESAAVEAVREATKP